MSEEMKYVPLNDKHIELGGKMVPFAGFNMPVRYSSDKEEHLAVRNAVGVFDVSHMGEFIVEGPEALSFVQYVTSNDVSKLEIGGIQYAYLPNEDGGIVDDLLVYKLADEKYLLVVNASNIDKDFTWINKYNTFDCTLKNVSDDYALFAVQGPKAVEAINSLSDTNLSTLKYYSFITGVFAGVNDVLVSATGYTGAGGFEVMVPKAQALQVWDAIFESGADLGIQPIGLGARDTLRLEKGYCLYGNDIDDTTSPLEAGLGWVTKLTTDFVGKDKIVLQKEAGLKTKLVGFKMIEKGIPRAGYNIVNGNEEVIGQVTSGTMSPLLNIGIGVGYIQKEFANPGSEVFVQIRKKVVKAEVVKLPFV